MSTPRYSPEKTAQRFWAKANCAGPLECWVWKRSVDGHGYGQVMWLGKNTRAHRIAFELANGLIPAGLCVLHSCDNVRCVNPAHLFLGSPHDNIQDMMAKGRGGHGCSPGEINPNAKLTEEDVRRIRQLRAAGEKLSVIASQFQVTQANISYIAKRKGWRHVL